MSNQNKNLDIQTNINLSEYTTIGLGGPARYFTLCASPDDLKNAVEFAHSKKQRIYVLGGGSNVIFSDKGFDGIVIKVNMKGMSFNDDGNFTLVSAKAGEQWDAVVENCVENNLAGIECLSGIPGSAGATPIQNVGAYGQEVRQTVETVKALERQTLREVQFSKSECAFGYRQSRFKSSDADKFIITEVVFRLQKNAAPVIRYSELEKYLESGTSSTAAGYPLRPGRSSLEAVRSAVIELRKKKSMVIDPGDRNSRSVGSFFINPILSEEELQRFNERRMMAGDGSSVPFFFSDGGIKIPAAWLVEHSGFQKGYRHGKVGISSNHALALVNFGGTTKEMLTLAEAIEEAVFKKFGVRLRREAAIIGNEATVDEY